MLINWIQIALIGFGIILSTSFFLRSSFLKKKNAKKLEEIGKQIETVQLIVDLKMSQLDRYIQEACHDLIALNLRTTIVETRLEERNTAPKKITKPKPRLTPKKVVRKSVKKRGLTVSKKVSSRSAYYRSRITRASSRARSSLSRSSRIRSRSYIGRRS